VVWPELPEKREAPSTLAQAAVPEFEGETGVTDQCTIDFTVEAESELL